VVFAPACMKKYFEYILYDLTLHNSIMFHHLLSIACI